MQKRTIMNHFPELNSAGLYSNDKNSRVVDCLTINKENETPDKLKKY